MSTQDESDRHLEYESGDGPIDGAVDEPRHGQARGSTEGSHGGPLLVQVDRLPVALFWYTVVGGLMCFWRLGAAGLMAMEGMVVDGARHMLASGNWTVPHVYGEIYTYKPALAYWLAALPLRLSEMPSAWGVRLPSAMLGFCLGLLMLALVRRLAGTRAGLFAALAMLGGVLLQQKIRLAEFDIPLLVGAGVAILAACYNLTAERPRTSLWLLGYVGLAAGFLAKGGPALMVYAPGLLVAAWASGRFRRLFQWGHLAASAVFVGLLAWYFWAAWNEAGAAAFEQPLLEAKARGLGWLWGQSEEAAAELNAFREAEGQAELSSDVLGALGRMLLKPLVIWQVCLPWSIVLPAAFVRRRKVRGNPPAAALVVVARSFLVSGAVTFMLVNTHESRYYLPLSVPLAILCGLVVAGGFELSPGWRRGLRRAAVLLVLAVAVLTPLAGLFLETPPVPIHNRAAIVVLGLTALVVAVLWSRNPARQTLAVPLTISALCILIVWSLGAEPRRASTRVLDHQAAEVARHIQPAVTVWTPGPADVAGKNASLFFYLGHPVQAFRPGGELPPAGSYCVLPSDRLSDLEEPAGFVFEEIARVEQARRDFLVGRCSWPIPSPL